MRKADWFTAQTAAAGRGVMNPLLTPAAKKGRRESPAFSV
jgi:hypothetical protein